MRRFILPLLMLFASAAAGSPRMIEPETPLLMRALGIYRSGRSSPSTVQPRQNPPGQASQAPQHSGFNFAPMNGGFGVNTKANYISFIRSANSGNREDCRDRYERYLIFFNHDSTLSGSITTRQSGPQSGRLDVVCDFLSYAHWCFALGFAYDIRDLDDLARTTTGSRCFTYQEFCAHRGRTLDPGRIDDYLSRIIDEIMFYNTNIRNSPNNTVAITTETRVGNQIITSTNWRVYNTDTWVQERIPVSEMTRMLCR